MNDQMLLMAKKIKYRGTSCSRKLLIQLLHLWVNQMQCIRCNENMHSVIGEALPTLLQASGKYSDCEV